MGLPAVKREARTETRRPNLRVVKPSPSRSAKRHTSNAAAKQAFVMFGAVVAVAALLGVGRVWLSVQAAEASMQCGTLQTAIKSARYQGDMLEIQQSALATPSRIQAQAVGTMGMAPATSVSYMRLEPAASGTTAQLADARAATAPAAGQAVFRQLAGVVAAEARLLLVGDVGLASSR